MSLSLQKRECVDLISISSMINKLKTSNDHFNKAFRRLLTKLTQQFCPNDIKLYGNMLVISPCPFHNKPYDQLTFDPYSLKFRCNFSSDLDLHDLIDDDVKREIELAKAEETQKVEVKKEIERVEEEDGKDGKEEEDLAKPAVLTKDDKLEDLYRRIKEEMEKNDYKCMIFGNAGLICTPCPVHNSQYDALFYDISVSPFWRCAKEPDKDITNIPIYTIFDDELRENLIKKSKVTSNDLQSFRAQIVERHYLTNNLLISIRKEDSESYTLYKYDAEEGIYKELGAGAVIAQLQLLYEELFGGKKPPITLRTEMKSKIYELTVVEEGEKIFSPIKGDKFYLVGRKKDIEINTTTGEVRFLEKDPINRPFRKRMNFDFNTYPPIIMPSELDIFKKYTTPRFFKNILFLLVKGVILKGSDTIFVNYSRIHGTGKTSLFNLLEDLFEEDIVARVMPKHFASEFVESKYINKRYLMIDEYKGKSENINNILKQLASDRSKIPVDIKYESPRDVINTLTVSINTNRILFPDEFLEDTAFMARVKITPFIHVWRKEEYPNWTKEQKEKIVLWIIKYLVPAYFQGRLKTETYPRFIIEDWIRGNGGIPPTRLLDFLDFSAYQNYNPKNTQGVFVPLEKAYKYYVLWCDKTDTLPMADEEFYAEMKKTITAGWLIEKNGEEGLYMKKKGIEFFI